MITQKEISEIKRTPDNKLLELFPQYTRKFMRDIKSGTLKNDRVLVLDIETSPIQSYTWGIWEQNISIDQIKHDWFVFCWSAKWLNSDKILSDRLTGKEARKMNDKRILKSMWELLDEADIVIAHNGDKFDIRKINTRFLKHGMNYPSPYKSFDTLKICKREFGLTSNKLDYVCRFLGMEGKVETGGQKLWNECMLGDEKALKKMSHYCDNDIKILEQVYLKLEPYIRNNPKSWNPRVSGLFRA